MLFLIHNHTFPPFLYRLDVINMNRLLFQSMATKKKAKKERDMDELKKEVSMVSTSRKGAFCS